MLTLDELKKMDLKDLLKELKKAKREKFKAGFGLTMQQDKKTHLPKKHRKYVAQINTMIQTLRSEDKKATS